MQKRLDQSHDKFTIVYALSRLFERASFYGLRGIIVLYMIGESINMSDVETAKVFGWFVTSVLFSKIIGALLGDLIIGNKKTLIIGGIIQALGAFVLCYPTAIGLYTGLGLVVIGGGLYSPNMISHFGKLYLNKTKLLDAAFTMFYLAVNLGSFVGVLLVGYLSSAYGWNLGFIVAGVLMLVSVAFPMLSKENIVFKGDEGRSSTHHKTIKILTAILFIGLFWALYELSKIQIFDLNYKISEVSRLNVPKRFWDMFSSAIVMPIGLVMAVLWSYFYSNQFVKITIGFVFGVMAFAILLLVPDTPTSQHVVMYLISLLLLGVSEIHLAPIIYSVLTQYTNPKYLAILISLAFIPTRLFYFIVDLFNNEIYDNPILGLRIGLILMIVASIVLIYITKIKKQSIG